MGKSISYKILFVFIFLYIFLFSYVSFCKFNTLSYTDFDLAIDAQATYNILHGSIESSIHRIPFLGNHMRVILFLIAPIYYVFPSPLTLLFLQAIGLGLGALFIFKLAKDDIGETWALLLSFIYLIYPPLAFLNLFEFHPTALVVPLMLAMFYFFKKERFIPFLLFMFLAMSCQENIALIMIAFGFYAALKRMDIKWIVWPIISGIIYFILCIFVIMPYYSKGTIQFFLLYQHLGNNLLEIIKNIFLHPLYSFKVMFTLEKMSYILQLLAPVGFLSLFSPIHFIPVIPIFLQHFLSLRSAETSVIAHYQAEFIPFIFIAAIFAVKNMQKRSFKVLKERYLKISVLTIALFVNLYFWPYAVVINAIAKELEPSAIIAGKKELLSHIPDNASVASSFEFLSPLANRRYLYSFHHIYTARYTLSARKYPIPIDVDYALLDSQDSFVFGNFYRPGQSHNIRDFLKINQLGVLDIFNSSVLFRRNQKDKYSLYTVYNRMPKVDKSIEFSAGDSLRLIGYRSSNTGDKFNLGLYWQPLNKIKDDLNLFFEVFDPSGNRVMAITKPICWRIFPTSDWTKDIFILDNYQIILNPDWIGRGYTLNVGVYDYQTGQILFISSPYKDSLDSNGISFELMKL